MNFKFWNSIWTNLLTDPKNFTNFLKLKFEFHTNLNLAVLLTEMNDLTIIPKAWIWTRNKFKLSGFIDRPRQFNLYDLSLSLN